MLLLYWLGGIAAWLALVGAVIVGCVLAFGYVLLCWALTGLVSFFRMLFEREDPDRVSRLATKRTDPVVRSVYHVSAPWQGERPCG